MSVRFKQGKWRTRGSWAEKIGKTRVRHVDRNGGWPAQDGIELDTFLLPCRHPTKLSDFVGSVLCCFL